jgi:gliding motility-associatede transport system auxiliary component
LQDRFWVQVQNLLGNRIALPTAANGTFVVNALDNLTGSNDLISVRNRGHFTRPFTRVDDIRQQAELRFREKEQELLDRLQETERRLVALQQGKADESTPILSAAQLQEIERFRQQKIQLRKELRQVRHELHKNIENLESWTKFINIGLMPILVAVGGIGVAVHRQRRRKLAAAEHTVQSQ